MLYIILLWVLDEYMYVLNKSMCVLNRYLKQTKNAMFTYGGKEAEVKNTKLNFFCDADWGNGSDQKSISGYVTIIAGGAVTWGSNKQVTIALSTAEVEYITTMHTTKQVLWHTVAQKTALMFAYYVKTHVLLNADII